ncbi:MAG: enoyl-CoA hydratase/isomerase family protein [Burkholderiales bacterium]|nr:enoyl-CoA hydratase/isomerase family protein [Burkholderiales bacterium]
MNRSVVVAVEEGIGTIAFDRPQVMNALDERMMIEFREAAETLEHDAAVRCVVLEGRGKAFVAGGDVALFAERIAELARIIVSWGREMHFAIQSLRRMPKPVLASVHGAVAGAGFSIMCAADLALAEQGTRFSLAYASIGASPDGGSTHFLPRLVGMKRAMELTMLPDLFDAATAQQLGLVNWVVPAAQRASRTRELAHRLANGPTIAYGEAKRLLNASSSRSIETQMEEELFAFARCAATADLAEGVDAFVHKRAPAFTGR